MYKLGIKTNKGFTLVELTVVVAIIGILASIVITNLSKSRIKNADTAAQASLNSAVSQAEMYYQDNSYSYTGVCSPYGTRTLYPIATAAAKAVGISGTSSVQVNVTGSLTRATCRENGMSWAIEVPMKNKNIGGTGKSAMYCIDDIGGSGYASVSFGNEYSCPTE